MARKRYTTEQIIGLLREAEVRIGQGEAIGMICRGLGIAEQTYYRWRREHGGLKLDQAKRLKDLERENERLKKSVSELTLDKLILKEPSGKILPGSGRASRTLALTFPSLSAAPETILSPASALPYTPLWPDQTLSSPGTRSSARGLNRCCSSRLSRARPDRPLSPGSLSGIRRRDPGLPADRHVASASSRLPPDGAADPRPS